MPIIVTPEQDAPLPSDTEQENVDTFREKARVLSNTVDALAAKGLEVSVAQEDKNVAHAMFASKQTKDLNRATPAAIVHLESLLTEWDHELLDAGHRLRNYVTNKLIIESNDGDARVRLKALELLGKLSNVGLFSERIDVSVTHRSVADIETELRKTLELYSGRIVDAPAATVPAKIAELDFDDEFGLSEDRMPDVGVEEASDGPQAA